MQRTQWLPLWGALLVGTGAAGCALSARAPEVAPEVVVEAAAPVEEAAPDPVDLLIAESFTSFERGRDEFHLGHLQQARVEFDRALDRLLESPDGARLDPRLRAHFDQLVDRISAYELSALAMGDGFDANDSEPASLDELLSVDLVDTVPAPDLEAAVRFDLERTAHDVPIPVNRKVLQYIALFQGRLREWFTAGLARSGQYVPMIHDVFEAEGLPLDLAYVPLIESAFKPNALSRARARGMWQFMLATGIENGLKEDWYIDERSDPEKATLAAAKYLRTLVGTFKGDWHLALASYNGGPGRVQRALRRSGKRDFWSLAGTRSLPRETREYVPMILAGIVIARNPALYGFRPAFERPSVFERVTLPAPVDLRLLAEWTGASIDDIQALNPELRRWTTPLGADDYEVRIPVGTAEIVRYQLDEAAGAELVAVNWHVVKKGETLSTIARALRVSAADLAGANALSTRSRIAAGQKLLVPREPTTLLAARTDRPVPALAQGAQAGLSDAVPASTRQAAADAEPTRMVYRVRKGDTLYGIARRFQTTVATLQGWNAQVTGSRIQIGQRLVVKQ
jgi:membrane-bound lytic murein transglycosylase D